MDAVILESFMDLSDCKKCKNGWWCVAGFFGGAKNREKKKEENRNRKIYMDFYVSFRLAFAILREMMFSMLLLNQYNSTCKDTVNLSAITSNFTLNWKCTFITHKFCIRRNPLQEGQNLNCSYCKWKKSAYYNWWINKNQIVITVIQKQVKYKRLHFKKIMQLHQWIAKKNRFNAWFNSP